MKPQRTITIALLLALAATPALAEEKTGMPQMDPTWIASQLFWLSLAFVLLYVVVSRSIIPNVEHVLQKRSTTLKSDIDSAEAMGSEAAAARSHYEKAQADARREAGDMIAKVQADASRALASEQATLDITLKKQIDDAEIAIAARLAAARAEIAPSAASLAAEITGKLLGKKVDASDLSKLIANAKA